MVNMFFVIFPILTILLPAPLLFPIISISSIYKNKKKAQRGWYFLHQTENIRILILRKCSNITTK